MTLTDMTIEKMRFTTEMQMFDRKSARANASAIATVMIAFANADGGLLAIGIEDGGMITGIDSYTKNINEILRAPFDFCVPTVQIETETVDCVDYRGNPNHLLLIRVFQSNELHANHRDEVFRRIGDRSKKMTFEERLQMLYAKGARYFEDEPVYGTSFADIDLEFVEAYCKKIGFQKTPEEYIRQNRDFMVCANGRQELSGAAVLLFGKKPQQYFRRARVRFIRYEGTEARVGARMNVIKDEIFEGKILDMIEQSIEFVGGQIKEHTYLGADGRFVTEPEYPEFAWKEIIVNAIAHRDYSIKGTDIQIKMFDDHMTVESPGTLPGTVKLGNMRQVHFSRNPKIAEMLQRYAYVKEFGEGVDRLYEEMESVGLPEPEFRAESFMFYATIKNRLSMADFVESIQNNSTQQNSTQDNSTQDNSTQDNSTQDNGTQDNSSQDNDRKKARRKEKDQMEKKILAYCAEPRKKSDIARYCGYRNVKSFAQNYLKPLIEAGLIEMTVPDKPTSRNQRYVSRK